MSATARPSSTPPPAPMSWPAVPTAAVVQRATAAPLVLTAPTALWSVASAALAGVLAGLYPARKASRVDIIAAVRAE